MHAPTETIDRLSPAQCPSGKPIGFHRWRNLLFAHWKVPEEVLRPLLPPSLTIDTFEGDAWVGLVPFEMHGIRPWWSPSVYGISSFFETNVRTYVHYQGQDPGVWFFSLDASSSLAVRIARWRWHLAYYRSVMSVRQSGSKVSYQSRRLWPGQPGAKTQIDIEVGELVNKPELTTAPGYPAPGTLEHWLVERYLLYAEKKRGLLLKGHVHHPAYRLQQAELTNWDETLVQAAGIPNCHPPDHVLFCSGVDVNVYPLKPI